MKKFILVALFLAFAVVSLFAVGSYFLRDNFVTNDAAPLADPHTTEPGGQSVDAVEVDGTMAIANGKLTFTAQATPVDGDLGLRYATNMSKYMGRAMFFKIKLNSLADGIAGFGNASQIFGFSNTTNILFDNTYLRSFGTNSTDFIGWTISNALNDFNFLTAPTTTDSFYTATILGAGNTANDATASGVWYAGQAAAAYTIGCFYFIKKNTGGNWLLQGKSFADGGANAFPAISSYNGAFSIDRWAISSDTLRDGYLSPVHYQSMDGTSGAQLFDDTPEVGAAYDSVRGNFTFTADNRVIAAGADPGAPIGWLTTFTTSDDDVFAEETPEIRAGDIGGVAMVFRYNSSNSHHCMVAPADGATDQIAIWTFEAGSYTQRAATNISLPATTTPTYNVGMVYDDGSTTVIKGFHEGATGTVFNVAYTHPSNFNSGQFKHGLRASNGNYEIDKVRFYPLGSDGEYAGFDAYFVDGGRRRWMIQ